MTVLHMFKDIDIFIIAAQAIWNGQDPYHIAGVEVFYPLPFYFLFLPFAWLPRDVTHVLFSLLSGIVLVGLLRRRALIVMLSSQVVLTFLLGQVDILMMALYVLTRSAVGGGIALAFLLLKPQIVLLLAPFLLWRWLRTDRKQILWFGGIVAVLFLASFLAQPDWIFSLLSRSGERMRAPVSSSLWGLLSFLPSYLWLASGALISFILIIWAWRVRKIDQVETVGLFISPFIFAYNLMPLYVMFRRAWILIAMVVISWLGFFIADAQSNDRASALVAVFALILFFREWQSRRTLTVQKK